MRTRIEQLRTRRGTRLTVRIRGEGPPLVLCNGWSTSEFFWKHMIPKWASHHTVVTWDYPGHGTSEPARDPSEVRLEALADDVAGVMRAAGIERATLVGYSMGCQVALEAGGRHPGKVDAIIPLLGSFERMIGTATHPALGSVIGAVVGRVPARIGRGIHRGLHTVMRSKAGIPLGRALGIVGPDASATDVRDYIEHFGTVHPPSVLAMAAAGQRHSARARLRRIEAPVLIVAGENDPLAPPSRSGAALHALLPQSRLVLLPSGTHTSLFEHHEELAILVDDFLR
ncbi:MAG: alpha/beta fold hydrolase, partial [Myxococcota bacterium]